MGLVIDGWDLPSVPVVGGADRFPVRRIYCIGRNYAAHALEMGSDLREPPFFFLKPADAVVPGDDSTIPYPPKTSNFHYEGELVVAIGTGGKDIPEASANDHVYGYGLGLDMTRRDLQAAARDKGRPWDMGKGFDKSAPCGALVPAAKIGHPASGAIWLKVNGAERQRGDLSDMIWNVPESIAYLSGLVELQPGDLIYTGTPEGVGAVVSGDMIELHIDGVGDLRVTIA
jgi:fumarylpyruvate hydrolase